MILTSLAFQCWHLLIIFFIHFEIILVLGIMWFSLEIWTFGYYTMRLWILFNLLFYLASLNITLAEIGRDTTLLLLSGGRSLGVHSCLLTAWQEWKPGYLTQFSYGKSGGWGYSFFLWYLAGIELLLSKDVLSC